MERKQNKASGFWRQNLESIPEDHRMQVDADVYGMPVAELMNWKGDTVGNKPVWTTSLIPSFTIFQSVNKYLLSPYYAEARQ